MNRDYTIAIASGKGGTGKTTVAVSLYERLVKQINLPVLLVDCDVEEPNDVLFFQNKDIEQRIEQFQLIPKVDTEVCTFCGRCADWCVFNAISCISSAKYIKVYSELCHSCGSCLMACESGAITEVPENIGNINFYDVNNGAGLVEGELKIGSVMQTMLISKLKSETQNHQGLRILDAPPGTSCPVVETINDVDFVVLVAEPTPFGIHDFKLMVDLVQQLEKPFGVVVNKDGVGSNDLNDLLEKENIEVLGKIPYSKEFASNYAQGNIMENIPEDIQTAMKNIADKVIMVTKEM
jgi:MinD superfamily P-loop ATPase